MRKIPLTVGLIASSMFSAVTPMQAAFAADALCNVQCTCTTPMVKSPVGSVVSASGLVQASTGGSSGLAPAMAGTPLDLGSQMITGPVGQAGIVVGSQCSLDIGPNSEVSISQQCGEICVQVTQNAVPPVLAGAWLPLLLIGGGAAAAVVISQDDDDDDGGGGGGQPGTPQ